MYNETVSYPHITVITNLCKELNISEHEFFTACDDETLTREKREIQKYRTLKKWIFIITTYFIGIITCFICNLVMDHKLPWFFIVFFLCEKKYYNNILSEWPS